MTLGNTPSQNADWAIVTPSYSGDFRRCKLLCRSIDQFVTGSWHHYIVVDAVDFDLFKSMVSTTRSVILVDDVLPIKQKRLFRIPFLRGRDVWWSSATGLSIGWHVQQMVKIAMATYAKGLGLIHCDSDMFFIRPVDVSRFYQDQRVRLYRAKEKQHLSAVSNPGFVKTCLRILGLAPNGTYHTYVDTLVIWRRETVLAMCDFLSTRSRGPWQKAFKNQVQISEYNLYGLYADEVEKNEALHFPTSKQLCKTHWAKVNLNSNEIARFFDNLEPQHVALCFQSFAGIAMDVIEHHYSLRAPRPQTRK